jgi:hypothetical protein
MKIDADKHQESRMGSKILSVKNLNSAGMISTILKTSAIYSTALKR